MRMFIAGVVFLFAFATAAARSGAGVGIGEAWASSTHLAGLFSPEDAELALRLTLIPEEPR